MRSSNRAIKSFERNNNTNHESLTAHPGFKACRLCNKEWQTRWEFLSDPKIELLGYTVNFQVLSLSLFRLNHSCGNILVVEAGKFRDLYQGQIYRERKTGTKKCSGYCLHESNLDPCPAKCECAWVSEVISIIKLYPKTESMVYGKSS